MAGFTTKKSFWCNCFEDFIICTTSYHAKIWRIQRNLYTLERKLKKPILYCRDLQAPQAALLWKEARLFENHCMGSDTLLNTIVSEHSLFLHPWKQSKTPAGKDKTFRKSWPLCPLYGGMGWGRCLAHPTQPQDLWCEGMRGALLHTAYPHII